MEALSLPRAAGTGEPAAGPRIFHVNWYFLTQLEGPRKFHVNWGVKEELLTGRAVKPRDVIGAWQGLFRFCCKILTPISAPRVLFSNRVWKHQKRGDRSYENTEYKLYHDRNVKYGMITEPQDHWGWKRVLQSHWVQPGTHPYLVTQTSVQLFLGHLRGWRLQTSLSPFQRPTALSRKSRMKFQLQAGVASLPQLRPRIKSQILNPKSQISSVDFDLELKPVWGLMPPTFVWDICLWQPPQNIHHVRSSPDVSGDWYREFCSEISPPVYAFLPFTRWGLNPGILLWRTWKNNPGQF